jgi:hypothetical protein
VQIKLDWDIEGLKRKFLELEKGPRRLGFGMAIAINKTLERAKTAVHDHARAKFHIRNPRFFFGREGGKGGVAGKITQKAFYPDIMYGELATGAGAVESLAGGDRARVLFPMFETGGERPLRPGSKASAVPLLGRPARPSINRPVPPEYTIKGLQFRAYKGGKKRLRKTAGRHVRGFGVLDEFGRLVMPQAGPVQWKGKNRTFLLPKTKEEPLGGVFQRIGPERGDIREIWTFRHPIQIDDRMDWVGTVRAAANQWFKQELEKQYNESVRHAQSKVRAA